MSIFKELSEIRRDPDNGILFGVCAGLADYYGWRRRTTRLVVFLLAFFINWPIILAYAIAVFVFPTVDEKLPTPKRGQGATKQATDAEPARPRYNGPLRERYARIERRMRRVEAYLHGNEHQLRAAFRDLETG